MPCDAAPVIGVSEHSQRTLATSGAECVRADRRRTSLAPECPHDWMPRSELIEGGIQSAAEILAQAAARYAQLVSSCADE